MDYMLMPLRRYADFSGRSQRKEYWMFLVLQLLLGMAAGLVSLLIGGENGATVMIILICVILLGLFIPIIAVQVRRFHDQDRSGWMLLLSFIPYVGSLVVLVFMCLDGTPGDNRFGPDPKGRGSERLVEVFN